MDAITDSRWTHTARQAAVKVADVGFSMEQQRGNLLRKIAGAVSLERVLRTDTIELRIVVSLLVVVCSGRPGWFPLGRCAHHLGCSSDGASTVHSGE